MHAFLAKKKKFLCATIIFGLITHFWMYSHGLVNPDTLWYGEKYVGGWEVTSGRWLLAAFDYLNDGLSVPIVNSIIAIPIYALACMLITDMLRIKRRMSQYLIPIIIISSPFLSQSITYYNCSDAYAAAFLLAVLSAWVVDKFHKWYAIPLGAVLLALSLGIYQSNLGVSASLCVMMLILDLAFDTISWKDIFKQALRFLTMLFVAVILYYVILQLELNRQGLSLSTYKGADNIGVMYILKSLPATIRQCYADFYDFYFAETIARNAYGVKIIYCCLFITFLILLPVSLVKKSIIPVGLETVLVILLPVACNAIDLMTPNTSIYLLTSGSMQMVIPFILSFAEKSDFTWRQLRRSTAIVASFLVGGVIYCNVLSSNTDSMVMWQAEQQTVQLANRICYDLESYDLYETNQKVLIAGIPRNGSYPNVSTLSSNANPYAHWGLHWETYDGSLACWRQVFHKYIGVDLNWCWEYEYRNIVQTEDFKSMPIYPKDGAISYIGDALVVKVSEME